MTHQRRPIVTTPHADLRCQQRGKTRDALALVYRYGDMDRHAGRSRRLLRLSRAACAELVRQGEPASLVERAGRIGIVVSEIDGAVVTVLNAN
jgi:hypothetical protein